MFKDELFGNSTINKVDTVVQPITTSIPSRSPRDFTEISAEKPSFKIDAIFPTKDDIKAPKGNLYSDEDKARVKKQYGDNWGKMTWFDQQRALAHDQWFRAVDTGAIDEETLLDGIFNDPEIVKINKREENFLHALKNAMQQNIVRLSDDEAQGYYMDLVEADPRFGFKDDVDGAKLFGAEAQYGKGNLARLLGVYKGVNPNGLFSREAQRWLDSNEAQKIFMAKENRGFKNKVFEMFDTDAEVMKSHESRLMAKERAVQFATLMGGLSPAGQEIVLASLKADEVDARTLRFLDEDERESALAAFRCAKAELNANWWLTQGAYRFGETATSVVRGTWRMLKNAYMTTGGRLPVGSKQLAAYEKEQLLQLQIEDANRYKYKDNLTFLGEVSAGLVGTIPYMAAMTNPYTGAMACLGMANDARERMILSGVDSDTALAISLPIGIVEGWIEKLQWEKAFGGSLSEFALRRASLIGILKQIGKNKSKYIGGNLLKMGKEVALVTLTEDCEEVLQQLTEDVGVALGTGDFNVREIAEDMWDTAVESFPTTLGFGLLRGSGIGPMLRRKFSRKSVAVEDFMEYLQARQAASNVISQLETPNTQKQSSTPTEEKPTGEEDKSAGAEKAQNAQTRTLEDILDDFRARWNKISSARERIKMLCDSGLNAEQAALVDQFFRLENDFVAENPYFAYVLGEGGMDFTIENLPSVMKGIKSVKTNADGTVELTISLGDGETAHVKVERVSRKALVSGENAAAYEREVQDLYERINPGKKWADLNEDDKTLFRKANAQANGYTSITIDDETIPFDAIIRLAAVDREMGDKGASIGDLGHEIFHAVTLIGKKRGLLNEESLAKFREVFGKPTIEGYDFNEEAAADAYGDFLQGNIPDDVTVKKVFAATKYFFKKVYNAFAKKSGNETPELNAKNIFKAIEKGDLRGVSALAGISVNEETETKPTAEEQVKTRDETTETLSVPEVADIEAEVVDVQPDNLTTTDDSDFDSKLKEVAPTLVNTEPVDGVPLVVGGGNVLSGSGIVEKARKEGKKTIKVRRVRKVKTAKKPKARTEKKPRANLGNDRFSLSRNPNLREEIAAALNTDRTKGEVVKGGKHITFCRSPYVFEAVGIPQGDIYSTAYTLRKVAKKHLLTVEQIAHAPDFLERPAAIFDDNGEGYIVLTEALAPDLNGREAPIVVYLRPDEHGNYIASEYSRTEKGEVRYTELKNAGRLLYVDKNKVAQLPLRGEAKSSLSTFSEGDNVKTPEDLSSQSSATIIAQIAAEKQEGLRYSIGETLRTLNDMIEKSLAMSQAQREYDAVVRRYTNADGTKRRGWMKAPNGQPTNLTGRQWVQVRTPAFKNWFGDWEAQVVMSRWHNIADAWQFVEEAAQDVTKYAPLVGKAAFKEAFTNWGIVTNEADGRRVVFPNASAGKMERVGSVSGALNKLFEKSHQAWREDDDGRHPNIVGIHHYLTKAHTQEGDVFVHFTVREDNREGNAVHAATVSSVEVYTKKAEITPGEDLTKSAGENDASATFTDNKISYFLRSVNRESVSTVVDENGEPKVVSHSTNAKFTIFQRTQVNDAGWLGKGFYFFGDRSLDGQYGRNVYACFLNVKEPYYLSNAESEDLSERNDKKASEAFAQQVQDEGYDGVYFNGDLNQEWCVFDPNQIKSATDNTGAFSPADNDIRFSVSRRHTFADATEKDAKETVKSLRAKRVRFTNKNNGRVAELKADWAKIFSEPAKKKSVSFEAHYAAANHIDTLFEDGVKLWEEPPRNGSRDIRAYTKYGCPFALHGEAYLAKVTVKEYANKDAVDGVYSVEALSVEKISDRGISAGITSIEGHALDSAATAALKQMLQPTGTSIPYSWAKKQGESPRYSLTRNPNLREEIAAALAKDKEGHYGISQGKVVRFADTLPILDFLGIKAKGVFTTADRLRKMVNKHNLSEEQVADLVERANSPVAVFLDIDGEGSNVILTDIMAQDNEGKNKPVMILLRPAKKGTGEYIASAYSRTEAGESAYVAWKSKLRYEDKNKIASIKLKGETVSQLKPSTAGEVVKTPEDYSSWTSATIIPQIAAESNARYSVTTPWRRDFPKAGCMTTRASLMAKYGDLFEKAKSGKTGSVRAAAQLVRAVAKPEKIKELLAAHPNASRVVAVHAEEMRGRNKIPALFANYIAKVGGLEYDNDIVQTVRANHTGANAAHRLFSAAEFDGDVIKGAEYIVVDDHITQGGTINALRNHIESNGGKVVAIVSLTLSQGSSIISPTKEIVDEVRSKHKGIDKTLRELGIADSVRCLTQSQCRYLASLSPNTLRDRIAETRPQGYDERSGRTLRGYSAVQEVAPQAQSSRSSIGDMFLPRADKGGAWRGSIGSSGKDPSDIIAGIVAANTRRGKKMSINEVQKMLAVLGRDPNEGAYLLKRGQDASNKIGEKIKDKFIDDDTFLDLATTEAKRSRMLNLLERSGEEGYRLGAEDERALAELGKAKEGAVLAAAESAQGFNALAMELKYGFNIVNSVINAKYHPTPKLTDERDLTKAGEVNGPGQTLEEMNAADEAKKRNVEEVKAKESAALQSLKKKAAERADEIDAEYGLTDGESPEQKQVQKDIDANNGALEESGGSEEGEESAERKISKKRIKREQLDFNRASDFLAFVEELVAKEMGINAFDTPYQIRNLANTAKFFLARIARQLCYSHARELIMRDLDHLADQLSLKAVEASVMNIYARIQERLIPEKQDELISKLEYQGRMIAEKGYFFSRGGDERERKVRAAVEEWWRMVKAYLRLDSKGVEEERNRLKDIIEKRTEVSDKEKAEGNPFVIEQDLRYQMAVDCLNALTQYGGLINKTPGEIADKAEEILAQLKGSRAELENAREDNRIKMRMISERIKRAVQNPKAIASGKAPNPGWFSRMMDSMMGVLEVRLRDLIRYSHGEVRTKAEADLQNIEDAIALASQTYNVLKVNAQREFDDIMKHLYGSADKGVRRLTETLDDEDRKAIAKQASTDVITRAWLLQRYVELMQTDDYAGNIAIHKRDGKWREKFDAVFKKYINDADMAFLVWVRNWYRKNLTDLNEKVLVPVSGIKQYSPSENYFPVKMKQKTRQGTDARAKAWSPLPSWLTPRVSNDLDFDERTDLLTMWHSRMRESAASIAYAKLGLNLSDILLNPSFKDAIADNHGEVALRRLVEHISDIISGGGSSLDNSDDSIAFADRLRAWQTNLTLSCNYVSALKQMMSCPVFALRHDIDFGLVWKCIVNVDYGSIKKLMASDGWKARYANGMSEAMQNAMRVNSKNGSTATNILHHLYNSGFVVMEFGDMVPCVWVGQGLFRYFVAKIRDTEGGSAVMSEQEIEEKALTRTWAVIEMTQQSKRTENLTAIQRSGQGMGRFIYQFLSSPVQQLAYEVQAVREALAARGTSHAKEANKHLFRVLVVNHILMTQFLYLAAVVAGLPLGKIPEKDSLFWDMFLETLLGQYGCIFLAGAVAEGTITGLLKGKFDYRNDGLPVNGIVDLFKQLGVNVHDLLTWNNEEFAADALRTLKIIGAPARHAVTAYENWGTKKGEKKRRRNLQSWKK